MTIRSSIRRLGVAAATASALLLASCAPGGDAPAPGDDDPGSSSAGEEVTFVWADAADADSLHFAGLLDSTTRTKRDQIFQSLLRWGPDEDGAPALLPNLATDWEVVDDLTWQFTLREGVLFHNGEQFNAEAAKASFDYYLDPDTEAYNIYRRNLGVVVEVTVIDEYTIQVLTDRPAPLLASVLTSQPLITAPEHLAENYDDMEFLSNNPVGTGAFQLDSWSRGREMRLAAFEGYWDGAPEIDYLVYRPMPEAASRVAALLAGDVDMTEPIPLEMLDQVGASASNNIVTYALRRHPYIGLDNANPGPTQSQEFRQALNYAVDWDTIIETLFDGEVVRTPAGINPLNPSFDDSIEPYPYDPERAEELIREAGYEPGQVSITLNYVPGRQAKDTEMMSAIAGYLNAVGVAVELRTHEWNTYLELIAARDIPHAHLMSRADSNFDAIEYMHKLVLDGEAVTNFHDPDFQARLDEAMTIVDPVERDEVAREFQREFQELAPMIFGYQSVQYAGINTRFEWPLDGFENYDASQIRVVG